MSGVEFFFEFTTPFKIIHHNSISPSNSWSRANLVFFFITALKILVDIVPPLLLQQVLYLIYWPTTLTCSKSLSAFPPLGCFMQLNLDGQGEGWLLLPSILSLNLVSFFFYYHACSLQNSR